MTTWDILKKTRAAWPSIRNRDAEGKNDLLRGMADSLMALSLIHISDDQLSLAIGKEGQNARLAARLTGYKIDIKPVSRADE